MADCNFCLAGVEQRLAVRVIYIPLLFFLVELFVCVFADMHVYSCIGIYKQFIRKEAYVGGAQTFLLRGVYDQTS